MTTTIETAIANGGCCECRGQIRPGEQYRREDLGEARARFAHVTCGAAPGPVQTPATPVVARDRRAAGVELDRIAKAHVAAGRERDYRAALRRAQREHPDLARLYAS